MPRSKSFEPDVALRHATELFWEMGYDATSISGLEERMGINRFSIYGTFGDKKALYLQCLDAYAAEAWSGALSYLQTPGGLEGIKRFLGSLVDAPAPIRRRGCLMMNSIVELSGRDADIDASVTRHFRNVERQLHSAVQSAKERSEIVSDVEAGDVARTLLVLAHGVLSLCKTDFGQPVARAAIRTVLDGFVIETCPT